MAIKWTEQQKAAVEAPVADILITAAAGSGKTQVLTGRILRRILDRQDITRLLIVTFTEAAAAEIRGRIAKVITDELQKNPKGTNSAHLRRQLALLPCAKISTIHSYCMGVIRENFFEAELPPSFRVADKSEAELMQLEAADSVFEKLYDEGNEDFLYFADSLSTPRSDKAALDAMLQVYKYAQSMPHPEKWLDESVLKYDINTAEEYDNSECERILLENAHRRLKRDAQKLASVISIFNMNETDAEAQNLRTEINNILALTADNAGRDTLRAALSEQIFVSRFSFSEYSGSAKDYISKVRKSVKDSVNAVLSAFEKASEECTEDIKTAYKTAKGLAYAVRCFTEEYTALKRERGVIDFGDMEHICISLLEDENGNPSEIADIQQGMFDEIYVDEYQDSNETQEYIFSLIGGARSGRPNTFTVGDMKQGIYGFRQANPALIASKKELFREGESEKQRKIILSKNFRSCKGVIDFVNFIFENIMTKKTGGTEYDESEALCFAASYPKDLTPEAELHIIETTKTEENQDTGEEDPSDIEAEARVIASRIKELIENEQIFDNSIGEFRKINYSDIAILLRSNNGQPTMLRALLDAGIPAYSEAGESYFETVEIKLLMSLLEIVDNPINDIPLIAVMRSPMFSFFENELAEIRTYDRYSEYFFAVCKCAEGEGDLSLKCKSFLKKLQTWREAVSRFACSELIDFLLTDSGYIDIVSGGINADEKTANLRLMVEKARMYEKSSFKGLYSFLNYMRNLKSRGSDSGEAHAITSSNSIVRIMTIHKSKGLEFPIVFLAGAGHRLSVNSKGLPLHKKLGLGLYATDLKFRTKYETPIRRAVKIMCREDEASEEIRVLYVALTRAKERLIITGAVSSLGATLNAAKEGAALISINEFEPVTYLQCILSCLNPLDESGLSSKAVIKTYNISTLPELCKAEDGPGNKGLTVEPAEFKYGYERLLTLPSKVTVTELKRISNIAEDDSLELFRSPEPKTPVFLQKEGKMSAAEIGTLIHFVMQTIPLNVNSEDDVKNHIEGLKADGIITEEAAKYIPAQKILAFFESPLGQRLKNADKVYREEAFTSLCSASVLTKNPDDAGESILLQGIIDCYFFEGDNIVLIDFKTDKVRDKEEIKNRYKTQIDAYADVLHKKYFSKISEKFIYLFDIGDIIVYN
ncbi:MAG: helicase-exonuclease AddAB subunit AddA [Clostridia bacterium]|nr:helicase-exonuclease AddAB subunit AddA [Clostridia bacterium]